MDYQKVLDTTGTYTIQEHLMAMKAGFKCSRLTDSLKENILEVKWNRNSAAQRVVYKLLEYVEDHETIHDTKKIDELLSMVTADKIINDTPHTFDEYFDKNESDGVI